MKRKPFVSHPGIVPEGDQDLLEDSVLFWYNEDTYGFESTRELLNNSDDHSSAKRLKSRKVGSKSR